MILLTGATGLLGSHVLFELITAKKSVRALYRDPAKIENTRKIFGYYGNADAVNSVEWVKADINDFFTLVDCLADVDLVYHTAGRVTFNDRDRKTLNHIHVGGTANVVNACLEKGNIRLCHVSSIASLGDSSTGEPVTEEIIWNRGHAASAYAISKHKAEMEVWRGISEGLDAVIVNPSVIIGPGMWMGPGRELFNKVSEGLKYYPAGSTGYVDVRDVARIMVLLGESGISGERFIINSENLSYKDFLTFLATSLQSPVPYMPITPFLVNLAVVFESIRSLLTAGPPRITKRSFTISSETLQYSNRKILDAMNFNFIPVETSLKQALDIFRRQT